MKSRWKQIFGTLFLAAVLLMVWNVSFAQDQPSLEAEIGYGGTVFYGRWYPLWITVRAGDEAIDGTVSVRIPVSYSEEDEYCLPVELSSGESRIYRIPIRPMAARSSLDVTLRIGEVQISDSACVSHAVPEEALIIGVLGMEESLADTLSETKRRSVRGNDEVIHAQLLHTGEFPEQMEEMTAFDAMVIAEGSDELLSSAQQDALAAWRQQGGILLEREKQEMLPEFAAAEILGGIAAQQEAHGDYTGMQMSYRFSTGLNEVMRVDRGKGLGVLIVMLAAYVFLTGAGGYLYTKRMDRSKELWILIPVLAFTATALVLFCGRLLGLYQPMSTSVHVTHYDERGSVHSEEMAMITYADLDMKTVCTKNRRPVERYESGYFSHSSSQGGITLRDHVMLGEEPARSLRGQATWVVRNLAVHNDIRPGGAIDATAWMEQDGLHICVNNQLDMDIHDAMLITEVGFLRFGDIAAGEMIEKTLMRSNMRKAPEGNQIILEGQMLAFSEGAYGVLRAAVDPETQTDETFKRSLLTRQEQDMREQLYSKLSLCAGIGNQSFFCKLIGDTPSIPCEMLLLDGKPIERSAQSSLLALEIPLERVSQSGYFYYPQGEFCVHKADIGSAGKPVLGETYESAYIEAQEDVCFGYMLKDVVVSQIDEIRIASQVYSKESGIRLEVYNHIKKEWTELDFDGKAVISREKAQQAVNDAGELFMRCSGDLRRGMMHLPEIIVEGWNSREGSDRE